MMTSTALELPVFGPEAGGLIVHRHANSVGIVRSGRTVSKPILGRGGLRSGARAAAADHEQRIGSRNRRRVRSRLHLQLGMPGVPDVIRQPYQRNQHRNRDNNQYDHLTAPGFTPISAAARSPSESFHLKQRGCFVLPCRWRRQSRAFAHHCDRHEIGFAVKLERFSDSAS